MSRPLHRPSAEKLKLQADARALLIERRRLPKTLHGEPKSPAVSYVRMESVTRHATDDPSDEVKLAVSGMYDRYHDKRNPDLFTVEVSPDVIALDQAAAMGRLASRTDKGFLLWSSFESVKSHRDNDLALADIREFGRLASCLLIIEGCDPSPSQQAKLEAGHEAARTLSIPTAILREATSYADYGQVATAEHFSDVVMTLRAAGIAERQTR